MNITLFLLICLFLNIFLYFMYYKKKLKHGYIPIKLNCTLFSNYIICLTIDFNYRWINTLNEATKLK